jgi:hypothetical protein
MSNINSNGRPTADETHLAKLHEGVEAWNQWRLDHPEIIPNLINAHLNGVDLRGADLSGALLLHAHLLGANLCSAELNKANLCSAELDGAVLIRANLRGAYLKWAHLTKANLCGADLSRANLTWARLDEANIAKATLTGCAVYGLSTWGLKGVPKEQLNLVISPVDPPPNKPVEPVLTVDYLEMAQFIYLLPRYEKLRNIIDAITSKVVLILGSFSDERKPTLDAMGDIFRQNDYVPVMFDFEKPDSHSILGTVETIARMAGFVVADFTDAKMVEVEVVKIAGAGPPILPLLHASSEKTNNAVLIALRKTEKMILPTYRYEDTESLLASLRKNVIAPANVARTASIESDKERSEAISQAIREKMRQKVEKRGPV